MYRKHYNFLIKVFGHVILESDCQYSQYLEYSQNRELLFRTDVVVLQYSEYVDYSSNIGGCVLGQMLWLIVCQYSQYDDYSPNMGGCLLGQMLW